MSDMRSYMWCVPDWRSDEMSWLLDNREQGVYRSLIDECCVSGSIVSDCEVLARFVREPLEYFMTVWEKIRPKFKPVQQGARLISPRLEQDRRRFMLTSGFNVRRAKKAAEARWNKVHHDTDLNARSNAPSSDRAMLEAVHSHSHSHTQEEENSSPVGGSDALVAENTEHTEAGTLFDVSKKVPRRASSKKATGVETPPPESIEITDAMRTWATTNEVVCDLQTETENMLDHYRAIGVTRCDWFATWRTWMRNSKRYAQQRNGSNGNGNGFTRAARSDARLKARPYTPKQ